MQVYASVTIVLERPNTSKAKGAADVCTSGTTPDTLLLICWLQYLQLHAGSSAKLNDVE